MRNVEKAFFILIPPWDDGKAEMYYRWKREDSYNMTTADEMGWVYSGNYSAPQTRNVKNNLERT
jgi:hypothetical protein